MPVATSLMRGTGWYRTMATLFRTIRRHRIDVVHTHLTRAAYIGFSASRIARVPIVHSVHIANNDLIYRRLARGKNRLVAVSNYVAGMLHGQGVGADFIDTVYNGTDFSEFKPALPEAVKRDLGIPPERRLIGLVGRVCREKGHLELIQAVRQLRREHPDAHMLFVGRVEEAFRNEVDEALRSQGLRDRVTMTGVRHDVPRLLDAVTLSTMPSHMETFGVAALEAMARGRAVVATRVGGLPEIVRHGQTGLLVDLRPEALAEAIDYLLTNSDAREQMGALGRRLVDEKFSVTEMVRQMEGVYQRAIY